MRIWINQVKKKRIGLQRSCDLEQKKNGFMRNDWEENNKGKKKVQKEKKERKKNGNGNGTKVKQRRLRYMN